MRGPWVEPTNLFVVAALPPGTRKSAVFKATVGPIYQAEKMLVDECEPEILEAETLLKITTSEAKQKADAAAKAERAEQERLKDEAISMAQELASLLEELKPRPRLVAGDITPEAAATLLAEQGGRLGVLSAEGGIFQILAGRYSAGMANLDLFLMGHAGDPLRVDRKGGTPLMVDEPALTLGLTVQPQVLRDIAGMPGFRGRGLLARVLYSLPENTVGWRQVGVDPPSPEVASTYEAFLANLTSDLHRWSDVSTLELSLGAAQLLLAAERDLEPRLRPHGDYGMIVDWASKLAGAVARIAGILHVAEHQGGTAYPISVETMTAALRIGDYFAAHALAAFEAMGADPVVEDARYVLGWIERGQLSEFTRREAHRGCRRFAKAADLDPVLGVLEDHGYLRSSETVPEGGGPRTRTFTVHPQITGQT